MGANAPNLKPIACCEVILHYAANNKPIKTETIMAKTRFTEIRLRAITVKLESEMWCVLNQMSENIEKFEAGELPAKEARMRHRALVKTFLRQDWYCLKAVEAANRIDGCEQDSERHYVTDGHCRAIRELQTLCEFFER